MYRRIGRASDPRLKTVDHCVIAAVNPVGTRVFFFRGTASTEIYTLSLHDALPISPGPRSPREAWRSRRWTRRPWRDRKSTRLNSSHVSISYAVFCLKKKNSVPYMRYFLTDILELLYYL